MAARLCQSASPDTIVISKMRAELMPDRAKVIDLGPRTLKRFAPSAPVFEAGWR